MNEEERFHTMSVSVVYVEEGGDQEPGYYWTFDDPDDPATKFDGPYETEEAALVACRKTIEAAYAEAVRRVFGDGK